MPTSVLVSRSVSVPVSMPASIEAFPCPRSFAEHDLMTDFAEALHDRENSGQRQMQSSQTALADLRTEAF